MEKKKSNGFVGGLGFILAAAGSAVGLGNLWSFPYKTSANGGAAFVIVYILSVIVLGSVVMIAEMHLGKRAKANPVTAFKKTNKNLGWIGLISVVVPFLITSFYIVLGGYTLKFTMNSFADNSTVLKPFAGNVGEVILYTAIFLIIAVIIVMGGIQNGIEKASKILMPILFVVLIGIVIYCLCLGSGVAEGLNYYLNPDFGALGFGGVLAAMGQAFFSLSLGMGLMISYGSYADKKINIGKSTIIIVFFDTLVAFLAGLAIFPAIYHYQAETGIELINQGIVLLFSSIPVVFETLGIAGKIMSFLFFGMVSIAAITSVIALLEVITQFIIQKFSITRKKAVWVLGTIVMLASVPVGISLGYSLNGKEGMTIAGFNWLDFIDIVADTFIVPIGAFGACVAFGWFAFKGKSKKEILSSRYLSRQFETEGLKLGKLSNLFAFMVKYVTPLLIAVIEIFGVINVIFPSVDGVRTFSESGLVVAITAGVLLIVILAVYFIFFRNTYTGTNDDEITIDNKAVEDTKSNNI